MNYTAELFNPGQVLNTGARDALHIEDFNGQVLMGTFEESKLLRLVNMNDLKGTSILERRLQGKSSLSAVSPGQRTAASPIEFMAQTVKVDTVITAKQSIFLLDYVQSDIQGLLEPKTAMNQAAEIAENIDKDIAAVMANGAFFAGTLPEGHQHATTESIIDTDVTDTTKLYVALDALIQAMKLKKVRVRDCVWVVSTSIYHTLLQNDWIISRDYTNSAGDTVTQEIVKMFNLPVIEYYGFGEVCDPVNGYTSLQNQSGYDIAADSDESKCISFVVGPEAVLGAKSIDIVSDLYYDKDYKQYNIETDYAYGFGAWRYSDIGALYTTAA